LIVAASVASAVSSAIRVDEVAAVPPLRRVRRELRPEWIAAVDLVTLPSPVVANA
jgi:hypothetical protein